ncbi:putative plant self-incompatibility S1 [Arabidopsis thaliana]|uniref:S-protein homolog n=3 Tax=Arabidopsis TaxID=3701 RepID=Q8L9S2_ARATH|nr:Plant self-incompatibility protein S1 family [Arabidopsis thaliana]KAG7647631.1 Plant self-incompatibility S1 [Arabidopsis thaliana x Arabidopsis arenosa]AAM65803.1 unknown [Arabidopsis thaliana]AEE30738.1 Plant self-incompatibility protein S1 family [Arabidopsis thaliana]OAP18095.1 hypothetical protein AXX17_AT1G27210 [Arabidopsis thaliana]CAA0244819.1 unnamed protein product [Arabidopsis thaliana]|eukprot:NP_564262.1 Plant self-incompatibility protein S1 family [Arabidopsis thaliana]
MAFSTNQNFIFVLFLFFFILKTSASLTNHSSPDGLLPFARKHVIIINKLVTRATLIVHCTNKGEDLGVIRLNPLDRFDFRFRVNLRKTTTYTCSFEWPGNTATFDIFRADRDDNPSGKYGVCSECIWSIYEPAPCRDRRDGGQPQCFPWAS